MQSFAYTAEHADGTAVRGTIDAADLADAERQLLALQLRVLTLAPVAAAALPVRLGTADLQTFNELLLQISRAGMPVEAGLAALAGEVASGKLKHAIDALVADLQAGVPLETAVGRHRGAFPPLYGRLIDAGIRSADLPGVLGRFGRHLQTVGLLRDALWRACAYPAVVFAALIALLTFLGYGVLPRYFELIVNMKYRTYERPGGMYPFVTHDHVVALPPVALAMELLGRAMPVLVLAGVTAFAVAGVVYRVGRSTGRDRAMIDALLALPLVGRALRDSYVAQWLDVAAIGATAGLDLPQAVRLAGDAVALPSLTHDSDAIAACIEAGRGLGDLDLRHLPATVPLTMGVADGPGQLPRALMALAAEYQQQAERQIGLIPGRVLPLLLLAIGLLAGGVLFSLWAPLAELLKSLTGIF